MSDTTKKPHEVRQIDATEVIVRIGEEGETFRCWFFSVYRESYLLVPKEAEEKYTVVFGRRRPPFESDQIGPVVPG